MVQEVIIRANTQVPLKTLLELALRSELKVLILGINRTRDRLSSFETQYSMDSKEFESRFADHQLEESLDFIDWMGEIKTLRLLEEKQHTLQNLQIS